MQNAPKHAKEGLTDGTPPILGIIPTISKIVQCIDVRVPANPSFGMTTRWPTVADCVFVCMVAVPVTRDLTHQGPCGNQESSTKIIVMTHSVIFFNFFLSFVCKFWGFFFYPLKGVNDFFS